MASCAAITKAGGTCKGIPIDASDYCYAHHPDYKEQQRRLGAKGGKRAGRGRPQTELEGIKTTLYRIAADIESGKLEKGVGAVLVQVYNAIRGCIEDQRKIRELDEVLDRLQALEERYAGGGGRKWG